MKTIVDIYKSETGMHAVYPGSVFNMVINNGYCSVTSGDMYFESDTCRKINVHLMKTAAISGQNSQQTAIPYMYGIAVPFSMRKAIYI